MKILDKVNDSVFPFSWVNLDYYPDSEGEKKEIYLTNKENVLPGLLVLFHSLFRQIKSNIKIYNPSWWDYCLDTWDQNTGKYDYELDGKSQESREYLLLLINSSIEIGYSGSCTCSHWDTFLEVILQCLISHKAPFSPIFYDENNDLFFYFHHTGSVGLYYKTKNKIICTILNRAESNYNIK